MREQPYDGLSLFGHASLRTTAIYGDVVGPEERAFAARMRANQSK